jgi:uncharacterized protein YukE
MADADLLRRGLESYEKELEKHNQTMAEAFNSLQGSLSRLGAVYEGTGAKEFKSHWARTTSNFNEYLAGAKAIQRLLDERIQAIKAFDKPGDL